MRLIDADDLIKRLEDDGESFHRARKSAKVGGERSYYFGEESGIYRAIVRVEQSETIDGERKEE